MFINTLSSLVALQLQNTEYGGSYLRYNIDQTVGSDYKSLGPQDINIQFVGESYSPEYTQ